VHSSAQGSEELRGQFKEVLNVISLDVEKRLHPQAAKSKEVVALFGSRCNASETSLAIQESFPELILLSLNFSRAVFQVRSPLELTDVLTHFHCILRLEPHFRFSSEARYAREMMQSSKFDEPILWKHGLAGEGQIIAHGDSGIDYDMCFFHDEHRLVPRDLVDLDHRKVVIYRQILTARVGGRDGHGTHTAASLAGVASFSADPDVEKSLSRYSGVAPFSKLAIYDMGDDGDIYPGNSIYKQYLQVQYDDTSARVSSNSWGVPAQGYDYPALDVDSFVYDHPDFLTVFPAGNFGEQGGQSLLFSLATPGHAKNALTVGASTNSDKSFVDSGDLAYLQISWPLDVAVSFASRFFKMLVSTAEMPLVDFGAQNASISLVGCHGNFSTPVVIFDAQLETCSFESRALDAQLSGSVRLFMYISDSPQALRSTKFYIPVVAITRSDSMKLRQVMFNTPGLMIAFPVLKPVLPFQSGIVAGFSSRGPTSDGRIKPDIVAPGKPIVSAKSDENLKSFQCLGSASLMARSGTSMATPIVAGHAALVREYFLKGFYGNGHRDDSAGFVPSAALIKAVFINSGRVLTKADHENFISPPPSVVQGYGESTLDRVLIFSNYSSHNLFVSDSIALSNGESKSFLFDVSFSLGIPFKVTLVWTDPPPAVTADYMLVHDLDLTVAHIASNRYFVGNSPIITKDLEYPNSVWDQLNNVEQVWVQEYAAGHFAVTVSASNVMLKSQSFALVVTGQFQVEDFNSKTNLCPSKCSGRGRCIEAVCQCDSGYFGADCSVTSIDLGVKAPGTYDVSNGKWAFFHITPKAHMTCITIFVYQQEKDASFDVFIAQDKFPTFHDHMIVPKSDRVKTGRKTQILLSNVTSASRYVVGVYGFCCGSSSIMVWSDASRFQPAIPGLGLFLDSWTITVAIVCFAGMSALIYFIYRRLVARKRGDFRRIDTQEQSQGDSPSAVQMERI